MNLSKLKVLKIGGHYKVKPFDRLIEELVLCQEKVQIKYNQFSLFM